MYLFTWPEAFSPKNKELESIHVLQFSKQNEQEKDRETDNTGLRSKTDFLCSR
jgi:hypothetical protein